MPATLWPARSPVPSGDAKSDRLPAGVGCSLAHARRLEDPTAGNVGDLPELPASGGPDDPFTPRGGPLIYKPLPNGGHLLYSIGPDSVDDGGKGLQGENKAGKTVRYAATASEGDMVIGWYAY